MKVLFKMVIVVLFAALATGCAGTRLTAGGMGHNGGGAFSYEDGNYGGRQQQGYPGGGLRAAPCEPFNADNLMAWATELGNAQHKRAAKMSNSNGRVNCSSSESAGSQLRSPQVQRPQSSYEQGQSRPQQQRSIQYLSVPSGTSRTQNGPQIVDLQ